MRGWFVCMFLLCFQKISIDAGSVPKMAVELAIVGGEEITISAQSFHLLKGFSLLRIDGSKRLVIGKHAFDNLNSTLLLLQVIGCDHFILENNAFKNMQGFISRMSQTPIRAEIVRCLHVSIQNSAFGRLQEAKFEDINDLELFEGAFTFENQGVIGRHGPATNLSFHNVTIKSIPRATFTSALAEINFQNCRIRDVYAEAFRASQISAILINGSTIHRFHSSALSEQTQIFYLLFNNCTVDLMEREAFMAPITNLTIQFSLIMEIKTAAIASSVTAYIVISDNEIRTIHSHGFVFNNWNKITMENNIIVNLSDRFLEVPYNSDVIGFSFSNNEIYNVAAGAFASIPELELHVVHFRFAGNFFNKTCHCDILDWLSELLNNTKVHNIYAVSFCPVDNILSQCFKISQGNINMKNFTELVCGPGTTINCEPYNGETKQIDSTSPILQKHDEDITNSVVIITLLGLMIMAIAATIIALLWKGGLWLKKRGFCVQYNQNRNSCEDEGAMVTEDNSERFEIPEELTQELLQELRDKLNDPESHDKARELIEKLYEQFIVDESYTNNNRQDEEMHLYEELGNMQTGSPIHETKANEGIVNFLKLMEDKLNIPLIDQEETKPPLVNEYSEPTDAAVHLYSELKNREDDKKSSINSHNSNGSKMAFRPLPDKPNDEAGPSSKY